MWGEDELDEVGGGGDAGEGGAVSRRWGDDRSRALGAARDEDTRRDERPDCRAEPDRRRRDNDTSGEGRGRRWQDGDGERTRGRREAPGDWMPDRFNRREEGGRPSEEERGVREQGGGPRGSYGGGGRGRGRQDDSGTDELPVMYSIHRASVQSVRPFGLFVKLEGYRKNGLVHVSQVSEHEVTRKEDAEDAKVAALRGVATEGDCIWVKVISLKAGEDGGPPKVGCSLKLVSQADGRDLDANNLILDKHERKPAWQQPKKMELGAVLEVTCTRCGGRGHLKNDCFASLDKQYDLLPDEDEALPSSAVGSAAHGSGANTVPLGRGQGRTQPAWMTQGHNGGEAGIGKPAGDEKIGKEGQGAALPAHIGSVAEALAVIEKLKAERKERKALRKERRKEKARAKKRRKRRKDESSDSGSESESENESESEKEHRRKKRRRKEERERKRRRREDNRSASDSESE